MSPALSMNGVTNRRKGGVRYKIILASASKRRSKILKECGIPHRVAVSGVPEKMDHKRGARFSVLYNARLKAEKIAKSYKNAFVIGADTVVLLGRRLIGKPKTENEARRLLEAFSGRRISVYTGLCVINTGRKKSVSGVAISKIQVKNLSPERIAEFVKIAGPHDKAGGFSIEGPGAIIFDDIEGSFYNILGLPMMKLDELFGRLGYAGGIFDAYIFSRRRISKNSVGNTTIIPARFSAG